jgi:hypothetical protein
LRSPSSRSPLEVLVDSLFIEPELASRTGWVVRNRNRPGVVSVLRRSVPTAESRSNLGGAALPRVLRRIESP